MSYVYILMYIPKNAFEQERVIMGVFTGEDILLANFPVLRPGAVLHNLDIETDFYDDNSYVYEKFEVNTILF